MKIINISNAKELFAIAELKISKEIANGIIKIIDDFLNDKKPHFLNILSNLSNS